MNEDKFEKLAEKYEAGNSTLQEEQSLFDNAGGLKSNIKTWSAFVKQNKRKVPSDLNDRLWESFQKRINKNRSLRIRILSAAASILLIAALSIGVPLHSKRTYNKKYDLLMEARNMLAESEQVAATENIIYEDDMIVIYISRE